jgi:purine-nucleoside phosphorylase
MSILNCQNRAYLQKLGFIIARQIPTKPINMSFHIGANADEIAETVFISGDPLRAKFMAETLLDDPFCYNEIRGMLGFTGFYNGKMISFQGTGMGMPSTAIYLHELISDYNVKNIVRLGSCGSIQKDVPIGTTICATAASGDSSMVQQYVDGGSFSAVASASLLQKAFELNSKRNSDIKFGPIFSSDCFYDPKDNKDRWKDWIRQGILAVEMETQVLYTIAAHYQIQALTLVSVSDHILTGEFIDAESREKSFTGMTSFALDLLTQ